ncbi:DNA binding domain-containing protein, excisionase family [Terribacillus saccharophilus]|uniref:DNA binding domain-containing protein, excisionase family n=1 Tax=Terribacillus saccharophilus TaxID=361277 RepID=A0AAX2EJW2_9BACI|nr:DNA binding domain-containing protein, excisionase family [Terribacillus saccharophilus]
MNSNNYITTKEVAQRLNKSISTIYRYVNEKKLRPVYEDKWQIDSSLLFREEDVDRLIEEQQNKPGYTTGEVAAKLSKHPSTIAMYIKTGKLKTEKREFKGRILNFISEQDLETLQKEIGEKESGYISIFNKQHNIHLYQSFQDSKGSKARIMSLDGPGVAELEDGNRIGIERLFQLGYTPYYNLKPQRYVTKKGYIQFQFRGSINPKSIHINIIESLIINMGHKNVKLREEEWGLNLYVKPGLIRNNDNLYLTYESLNSYLVDGYLIQRHDGILLQTDYMPILAHVSKSTKDNLKHYSKISKLSLDDYVESILEKHFNEIKDLNNN